MSPSCHLHPRALVRPVREDGPAGRRVYLLCVPEEGEPHVLSSASADGGALLLRARPAGDAPRMRGEPPALPFGLTAAELSVLQAAARGLTVPETAAQLHKGSETVKSQRNRIILKIGARNMTHAVCIAAEHGVVTALAA